MDSNFKLIHKDLLATWITQLSDAIEHSTHAGEEGQFSYAESNGWSRGTMICLKQGLEIIIE